MTQIIALTLFVFTSCITPGPNNLLLMNSGLKFGWRRSVPHALGVTCGAFLMIFIIGIGLGSLFTHFAWFRMILKVAGSAYMVYLAWHLCQATAPSKVQKESKPWTFMQAVLFQWVNPKAWILDIAAISMFVLSPNHLLNAFLLGAIGFVICLPCVSTWVFLGESLQKLLKNDKKRFIFNGIMVAFLMVSVLLIWIQ